MAMDIASAPQAYGQPCTVAQIQEREVDIQAVSELYHSLTKKVILHIFSILYCVMTLYMLMCYIVYSRTM